MRNLLRSLSEYSQISVGILLASVGLKAFLLPNGFLDGGVTGIAILVSEISGYDISFLLLVISVPFLLLAWFSVSQKIVLKSIFSIIGLAIFIYFENFDPVTSDKLLISIFGGLFLGSGIGLAIKNGAVLDGSEILGVFVNDRFGLSIGKAIFIFNVILFSATALILSTEVAMYSILTYLVTAKFIDLMIQGFEDYVGLMIVTNKVQQLEKKLLEDVGTGITVYTGARGYGGRGRLENIEVVHLVINRIEIRKTYNAIEAVDPTAFIIEFDVNNVKGGVLRKYLTRTSLKRLGTSLCSK